MNRVFISIDFADEKQHNQHRGKAGLFENALAGLKECQRLGMLTAFSTFSSPKRLQDGIVEDIIALGEQCGVNEIAVFDEIPAGNYLEKKDIPSVDSPYYDELLTFIDTIQHSVRPGIWAYARIRTFGSCECAGGRGYLKISHTGDVQPCDSCTITVGNVTETPMPVLLHRLRHKVDQLLADDPRCLMLRAK